MKIKVSNYRVHHRCSNCRFSYSDGTSCDFYCNINNDRPLMQHEEDKGYHKRITEWRSRCKVDFHGECDWSWEQA